MCGLLFEYDVRLSVKLYFAKSYMNIRTTTGEADPTGLVLFYTFGSVQNLAIYIFIDGNRSLKLRHFRTLRPSFA